MPDMPLITKAFGTNDVSITVQNAHVDVPLLQVDVLVITKRSNAYSLSGNSAQLYNE